MGRDTILVGLLVVLLCGTARGDDFWAAWGDGKAELDGYALTQPRYGELRAGTAVMIFVTEDFSDSLRVKADSGRHPPADVYPVLKLNFVRDFQTGIYDYNLLTSTFARTELPGWPVVKSSFSAQEWCGHVYQQLEPEGGKLRGVAHSYFDGEADRTLELPLPAGGVLEDAVPILVRGLRGDWIADGESRTVPFLPSAMRARLEHRPQQWTEATVRRGPARTVASALGRVPAFTVEVVERGGPTVTWTVEAAAPHRILAWRSSTGDAGELVGSARLAYWQLNAEGGEKMLSRLGLVPAPHPHRHTP
jgi:hypothetical protein